MGGEVDCTPETCGPLSDPEGPLPIPDWMWNWVFPFNPFEFIAPWTNLLPFFPDIPTLIFDNPLFDYFNPGVNIPVYTWDQYFKETFRFGFNIPFIHQKTGPHGEHTDLYPAYPLGTDFTSDLFRILDFQWLQPSFWDYLFNGPENSRPPAWGDQAMEYYFNLGRYGDVRDLRPYMNRTPLSERTDGIWGLINGFNDWFYQFDISPHGQPWLNDFSTYIHQNFISPLDPLLKIGYAGLKQIPGIGHGIWLAETGIQVKDRWDLLSRQGEYQTQLEEMERRWVHNREFTGTYEQFLQYQNIRNQYESLSKQLQASTPNLNEIENYWTHNFGIQTPWYDNPILSAAWFMEIGSEFRNYVVTGSQNWVNENFDKEKDPFGYNLFSFVSGSPAFIGDTAFILGAGMLAAEYAFRNPNLVTPGIVWATNEMGKGFVHSWNENPAHFLGEITGGIIGPKAIGKIGKLSPIQYGKFSFETGLSILEPKRWGLIGELQPKQGIASWKGLYLQNPKAMVGHLWTGIPDYRGNTFLIGRTTIPESPNIILSKTISLNKQGTLFQHLSPLLKQDITINIANPLKKGTITTGLPTKLTPYIDYSFFSPTSANAALSTPLMRNLLKNEGAPGTLQLFDSYYQLFKETSYMHPNIIRNPITYLDEHPMLQIGGHEEFLQIIQETSPKHLIYGTTTQSLQTRLFKTPGDIDINVINPELTSSRLLPYFQREFGADRVRLGNRGVGIELYYPETKAWAHAVDIHQWQKPGSIDIYNLPSGPNFSAGGLTWMGLKEQLLRKSSASAYLRLTPEGRVLSPKMHRGKDIADAIAGIREAKLMWSESRLPNFIKNKHISSLESIEQNIIGIQLKPGYIPGSTPSKLTWNAVKTLDHEINVLKSGPNKNLLKFDINVLEVERNNLVTMLNRKEAYLNNLLRTKGHAISMRDTHLQKLNFARENILRSKEIHLNELYQYKQKLNTLPDSPLKISSLKNVDVKIREMKTSWSHPHLKRIESDIAFMKNSWTKQHIGTIERQIQQAEHLWEWQNIYTKNPVEDAWNRLAEYEMRPISNGYIKIPLLPKYVEGFKFPSMPSLKSNLSLIPGIYDLSTWWAHQKGLKDPAIVHLFPGREGGFNPLSHVEPRRINVRIMPESYIYNFYRTQPGMYKIPGLTVPQYTIPGYSPGIQPRPSGPTGYIFPNVKNPSQYTIPGYTPRIQPRPSGPTGYIFPNAKTPSQYTFPGYSPGSHSYPAGPTGYIFPNAKTPSQYTFPGYSPRIHSYPAGPTGYIFPNVKIPSQYTFPGYSPEIHSYPAGPTGYTFPNVKIPSQYTIPGYTPGIQPRPSGPTGYTFPGIPPVTPRFPPTTPYITTPKPPQSSIKPISPPITPFPIYGFNQIISTIKPLKVPSTPYRFPIYRPKPSITTIKPIPSPKSGYQLFTIHKPTGTSSPYTITSITPSPIKLAPKSIVQKIKPYSPKTPKIPTIPIKPPSPPSPPRPKFPPGPEIPWLPTIKRPEITTEKRRTKRKKLPAPFMTVIESPWPVINPVPTLASTFRGMDAKKMFQNLETAGNRIIKDIESPYKKL